MKLLIWWTTRAECKAIGDDLPGYFPFYIATEYKSRIGRNGRGRIWCAHELDAFVEVSPWPEDTALGRFLGAHGAGVVIRAEDAPRFFAMPGVITDTKLERVDLKGTES